MISKDFSTMKKTLRVIQQVQRTAKVYTLWISYTHYEGGTIAIGVTLFRKEGYTPLNFNFYSFLDAEERLERFNEMMDYING